MDPSTLHADVVAFGARLAGVVAPVDGPGVDRARIDALRALEDLKNAAAGLQAQLTADFVTSQIAEQEAAGVSPRRLGRGVAAQIGLARRESPHRATRLTGLARVLTSEMPHTLAALRAGVITEWAATGLAQETACLTRADRATIDAEVAADHTAVERLGAHGIRVAAAKAAARLDPASVVARRRQAEADRHVSLRPAPDTMTRFSALLPLKDGVAAYAALTRAADTTRAGHADPATGDPRSRGQIMADTLVETLLNHASTTQDAPPDTEPATETEPAAETEPARRRRPPGSMVGRHLPWPTTETPTQPVRPEPGIMLHLIMTDTHLFGTGPDAEGDAWLHGGGPIDADLARDLVKTHRVWLRRLYTSPHGGDLISMDSRRRFFPDAMKSFIRIRDQVCRTPWCGAPIRHIDHAHDHADGGPTSLANGQGLCEACNHAKQAPGWQVTPRPDGGLTLTTPTGHTFTTRPTPPPGRPPDPPLRIDYLRPPGLVLEWQPDAA